MTADVMDLAVDRSLWRGVDRCFLAVLGGSMALHFALAALVALQPHRVVEDPPFVPPRPNTFRLRLPAPEVKPAEPAVAPSSAKPGKPVRSNTAARPAGTFDPRVGLLGVIGSDSPDGHGAFHDVLSDGTSSLERALDGATKRLEVASTELARRRDGEGPRTERVELATSGTKDVALGERGARAPVKKPRDVIFDPAPVPKDLAGLTAFVAQRKRGLQHCYERELPRSPTLQGRLVVRLTLDGPGRAADVEVLDEGLDSAGVASCVRTMVRGWVFPFDVSTTVDLPFVFNRVE